jgi:FdhD protein
VTSEKLIQTSHYCQKVSIQKNNNSKEITEEILAEETPVAIVYNGLSHVVMMASPCDLEDFAKGFSITEGIIKNLSDIYSIEVLKKDNGIEINVEISTEQFTHLKEIRRNLTGRTGCGLCGAESLDQVLKIPKIRKNKTKFSSIYVLKALKKFSNQQKIQKKTGATHASGLFDSKGNLVILKEDVGRHNALDKLIGAASNLKISNNYFVITSSRASYEMVQKVAYMNLKLLVAISAPTALAKRLADKIDMTLIGFARNNRYNCYTHPEQVIG